MKSTLLALAAVAVSAHAIEVYHAQEIQPYHAQEAKPLPAPAHRAEPRHQQQRQHRSASASDLLGVWQTNIPGAVYTTPSSQAGYDILHVSSGAAAGLLRLEANGTYSWNSYGGKRGRWVSTGRADYPIEIQDTVEKRRWLVGLDPRSGELIVWSDAYQYRGRRAALR